MIAWALNFDQPNERAIHDAEITCAAARTLFVKTLTRLGLRATSTEAFKAIPQDVEKVTLLDFRNILADHGVKTVTDPRCRHYARAHAGLMLWVDPSRTRFTVLSRTSVDHEAQSEYTCLDDKTVVPIADTDTVFVFQLADAPDATQPSPSANGRWFWTVLARFSQFGWGLILASVAANALGIVLPLLIMVVYDHAIGAQSGGALPMLGFALMLVVGFDCVFRLARVRLLARIASRLDYVIGTQVMRKLMRLPNSQIEGVPAATQVERIKGFEAIRDVMTGSLAIALADLPFVVLVMTALYLIGGPLTLIPTVGVAFMIGLNWIAAFTSGADDREVIRTRGAAWSVLVETLLQSLDVARANASDIWSDRYRILSARAVEARTKRESGAAVIETISTSVASVSALLTVAAGAYLVIQQQMSVGGLIAAMALVWKVLSPLQAIASASGRILRARRSITQLNRFFALPDERTPSVNAFLPGRTLDSVVFDRVFFKYSAMRAPALFSASFRVDPGEFVSITGAGGSGGTTCVKLMTRMHTAQAGVVYLGGADVRQLHTDQIRRAIGYVPQTTNLVSGTIGDNVAIGKPGAERAELERAAEQTGLTDALQRVGWSIDTQIGGPDDRPVSAPIARGVAMARAMIKDPDILLLDQPEIGLDNAMVDAFLALIEAERSQRTIIMFSHRPSFIRLADRALLMDAGSFIDDNTPDAIIKRIFESTETAA